jgi:amino acid transporter
MTDQPVPVAPVGARLAPMARLEPDAITAAQDTFIGAALVGPTVSVALTLAVLAAATAYAAPVTLLLTALPVLVIANAYRRLNLWNASCGASFEWVGRAISPYLRFVTGWLMITGTLIGTLSPVVAAGPNILAIASGPSGNKGTTRSWRPPWWWSYWSSQSSGCGRWPARGRAPLVRQLGYRPVICCQMTLLLLAACIGLAHVTTVSGIGATGAIRLDMASSGLEVAQG